MMGIYDSAAGEEGLYSDNPIMGVSNILGRASLLFIFGIRSLGKPHSPILKQKAPTKPGRLELVCRGGGDMRHDPF